MVWAALGLALLALAVAGSVWWWVLTVLQEATQALEEAAERVVEEVEGRGRRHRQTLAAMPPPKRAPFNDGHA